MRKWTEDELLSAKQLLIAGKTYSEIAMIVSKTAKAVRLRLRKEGLKFGDYVETVLRVELKQCECCSNIFEAPINQHRKYCSHSCAATVNNKIYVKRLKSINVLQCLNCGCQLPSKNSKYCSTKCQQTYYRSIKFKNGTLGQQALRKYMIEKHGPKCMECGWDKINPYSGLPTVQLEHVDGDSTNNKEENLKLLCPSCHSLTPTYMALNKGKGRKKRLNKYYQQRQCGSAATTPSL